MEEIEVRDLVARNLSHTPSCFQVWCNAQGIYRPHVRHTLISPSIGHGVIAILQISKGETFIGVPTKSILTWKVAKESEIGKAVEEVNVSRSTTGTPHHRISDRLSFYLYLIYCRSVKENPWYEWFRHGIPTKYSTPLTWTPEELSELQGTNLGEAVPHRLEQLKSKWSNALPTLQQRFPNLFPKDVYTFDALIWAHDTYTSRGFPAQLANPALAPQNPINPNAFTSLTASGEKVDGPIIKGVERTEDGASSSAAASTSPSSTNTQSSRTQQIGCLIPYIDLTNHKSNHPITWMWTPEWKPPMAARSDTLIPPTTTGPFVLFQAGVDIPTGAEVLNNYGAKANEEFLMGYGFTLRDNLHDEVTVVLGSRGLSQPKLTLLTQHGIQLAQYLRLDSLPESLLQLMRISVMNEEEIHRYMTYWIQPDILTTIGMSLDGQQGKFNPRYITPRNEIAALQTLRSLLLGRLHRIRPVDWMEEENEEATTQREEWTFDSDTQKMIRLTAADFLSHSKHEQVRRDANSASPSFNYHLECAFNYRLGQRSVLVSSLDRVDSLLTIALESGNTTALQHTTYVLSIDIDDSKDQSSSRKRRKTTLTGTPGSSPEPSSVGPSTTQLSLYDTWLEDGGATCNMQRQTKDVWRIREGVQTTASTFPLLLSLPQSMCISSRTIASTESFLPFIQYSNQLEEPLDEEALFILFLLHEYGKGEDSFLAPWISCVFDLPSPFPFDIQPCDIPSTLGEQDPTILRLAQQIQVAMEEEELASLIPVSLRTFGSIVQSSVIIQDRMVALSDSTGESVKIVLPIVYPPLKITSNQPSTTRIQLLECSPSEDDGEIDARIVLFSLVSLSVGSTVTLSEVDGTDDPILPYTTQLYSTQRLKLKCETILALYHQMSTESDESDRPLETAENAIEKSHTLPPLTQEHIQSMKQLYIDPSSALLLDGPSFCLTALVRLLFTPYTSLPAFPVESSGSIVHMGCHDESDEEGDPQESTGSNQQPTTHTNTNTNHQLNTSNTIQQPHKIPPSAATFLTRLLFTRSNRREQIPNTSISQPYGIVSVSPTKLLEQHLYVQHYIGNRAIGGCFGDGNGICKFPLRSFDSTAASI